MKNNEKALFLISQASVLFPIATNIILLTTFLASVPYKCRSQETMSIQGNMRHQVSLGNGKKKKA